MKVSKRKICILLTLVTVIGLQSISFATYQTVAAQEKHKKEAIERMLQEEAELSQEEQIVLELINIARKSVGLKPLEATADLQRVAKLKAKDLIENEYFSHNSEKLGTPFEMLKENGVDYYEVAGENLAGNTTPERAVLAWIYSRPHRENILEKDFEYTGIAAIESPIYGKVYVQIFLGVEEI